MTGIGPMPLGEHVLWFLVLSLSVSLVYNGLHAPTVAAAVTRGLRRWIAFLVGSAVLVLVTRLVEITLLS